MLPSYRTEESMSATTVLAIGLSALAASLVFYWLATATRRMLRDDGPLRLAQVLRARKLSLPYPRGDAETLAAAHAVRRCVSCAEHRRCDVAIAERDWKRLDDFCPNAGTIADRAIRTD
jgi:hypothetical protein